MSVSFNSLFNLYNFSSGRRLFVFEVIKTRAETLREKTKADEAIAEGRRVELVARIDTFIPMVDAAIAHDTQTQLTERSWLAFKRSQSASEANAEATANAFDQDIDRLLSSIDNALKDRHRSLKKDKPELASTAFAFRTELFPGGLLNHIHQKHIDQLASNDRVIAILTDPARSAARARMGLDDFTDGLVTANSRFRAALKTETSPATTYDEVRAANALGQERLLRILARILGDHADINPEADEARARLLDPILEQNEKIGAYLRQNRTPPDVDPRTGDELDPAKDPAPAPTA